MFTGGSVPAAATFAPHAGFNLPGALHTQREGTVVRVTTLISISTPLKRSEHPAAQSQ